MNKSVSIIVGYENNKDYLNVTIDSILRQTHEDIRLLLSDLGSSDGSSFIAHAYSDPRILHVDPGEVWHADYVVVLQPGDILYPEFIRKALEEVEKNKSDLLFASHYSLTREGKPTQITEYSELHFYANPGYAINSIPPVAAIFTLLGSKTSLIELESTIAKQLVDGTENLGLLETPLIALRKSAHLPKKYIKSVRVGIATKVLEKQSFSLNQIGNDLMLTESYAIQRADAIRELAVSRPLLALRYLLVAIRLRIGTRLTIHSLVGKKSRETKNLTRKISKTEVIF